MHIWIWFRIHSRHTHRQEVPIDAAASVTVMGAEIETASSALGAKGPGLELIHVVTNYKGTSVTLNHHSDPFLYKNPESWSSGIST